MATAALVVVLGVIGGTAAATEPDTTPPAFVLSGSAIKAVEEEAPTGSYELHIAATDGSESEPQSGVAKIEVSVDGSGQQSWEKYCPEGSCSLEETWTWLPANFSGAYHVLTVKVTDHAGNTTEEEITPQGIEEVPRELEHGTDTTAPRISFSGTAVEAAETGATTGEYELRMLASDGSTEEPQSGVSKIEVAVDGTTLQSFEKYCPVGDCRLRVNWPYDPANFSGTEHVITVTVKDHAGNVTTRTLELDRTPPVIELSGPLTEGLKEGTTEYPLHVHATDGEPEFPQSGVKKISIAVDGETVKTVEQTCRFGSCPMDLDWIFDSETFPGLFHRITVEAEDLAGNVGSSTLEPQITASYAVEAENGEQTSVTGRISQQEPNGNLVVFLNAVTFGEPETAEGAMPQVEDAQPPKRRRAYRFTECAWDTAGLGLGSEIPVSDADELRKDVVLLIKEQAEPRGTSQQCHGELETGLEQTVTVRWAVSASGLFFYRQGKVVWVEERPDCKEWGPKAPAKWTDCETAGNLSTEHLDIIGDWRWPPATFSPGYVPLSAVCARLNGVLPVNPPKQENGELVIHESMHFHYWPVDRHGEEEPPCNWEHPGHVSGY